MKRFISVLFALVLVLSFSLIPAMPAQAATINVPGDYTTIQEAIDAASPGDTINVADGTYTITAAITVDEEVTITGNINNPENVVVTYAAPSQTLDCFDMQANNVTVQGISAVNGRYGFNFATSDPTGCTISDCVMDHCYEGAVNIDGGSGHTISDNTITHCLTSGTKSGVIYIYGCPDTTIDGNTLTDNGLTGAHATMGIYVKYTYPSSSSERVEVINNNISGMLGINADIQVYDAPYTYIYNNTISDSEDKGITIFGIQGNPAYTGTSNRVEVIGNTISSTYYPGLQACNAPYTYFYNNTLTRCNYYGGDGTGDFDYASIHIDVGSSDCLIDSNTVSDGINGIQLWSDDCTVTNNTIYDMGKTYADTKTTGDGTYYNSAILYGDMYDVNMPTSATISGNDIYDNYWGLFVISTYTGTVTAEDNWWGSANGPEHAGNTFNVGSQGDAVSDNVDYVPWLDAPYATGTSFAPVTLDGVADYSSIQAAIDDAITTTITCAAGTYDEQVVIDKSLTLQGEGDTTIIQPTAITQTFNRKKVGVTESDPTNAIVVATVNVGAPNSVTIKDLKIDSSQVTNWGSGSKNVGILYQGTAGTIDNITFTGGSSTDDVGDSIYVSAFEETVAVEIKNCDIGTSFYKNGITCNFAGLTANIHDNTVTGAGPIDNVVQNCIQIGRGATGSMTGNTVSNVVYDPAGSVAAGLLVSSSNATVTGNTVTDCQKGIAVQPFDAGSYTVTISNNTISSAGLKGVTHPDYVAGISIAPQNAGATIAVTIEGNDLTNDGPYSGIEFYGNVGTVDATVTGNEISGWTEAGIYTFPNGASVTVTITGNTFTNNVEEGIASWGVDSSTPPTQTITNNTITGSKEGIFSYQTTTTAHCNNIHGNTVHGVINYDAAVLDATNNWWGDASGPEDTTGTNEVPPCTDDPTTEINANGTGDNVSDNVDYCPWYGSVLEPTQSGETATGTGVATFTSSDGNVRNFTAVDEEDLPPDGKPDLNFPHGFFAFDICCLEPGETATVTIELPDNVPVGTEYWKYGPTPTDPSDHWYQLPMGSDDGDNVITITLVDGGLGDDDGLANGLIVDSGGPGQPPPPPSVGVGGEAYPVNKLAILAPWIGLALVIALGGGILVMRRRRAD